MIWRRRFEALIAELRAHPAIVVGEARIGLPTPAAEIARWKAVAGAAWPEGMSELYAERASVEVEFIADGPDSDVSGGIHLPPLSRVWDYGALKGMLWFDFLEADHPFHQIRPIDMFTPEAYAVLYPVPGDRPATVHYHYCGEVLVPTGLTYVAWLELLFRARGIAYWLDRCTGPHVGPPTWVEDGHARMSELFPDFVPASLGPKRGYRRIN
jgi:hypothetical protein